MGFMSLTVASYGRDGGQVLATFRAGFARNHGVEHPFPKADAMAVAVSHQPDTAALADTQRGPQAAQCCLPPSVVPVRCGRG